jgi:hypothetical protein
MQQARQSIRSENKPANTKLRNTHRREICTIPWQMVVSLIRIRTGSFTCQTDALSLHAVAGIGRAPVSVRRDPAAGHLPARLMSSLTCDQGTELADHKRFTVATNVNVYFCDPRSPWQRGSNEDTDGLLRQYFPKGADLIGYSQSDLDAVALRLNTRPRKTLGFMTPAAKSAHASFDSTERMLDRLPALTHLFRMLVEPALNRFENVLVFPSRDPPLFVGGALMFDRAVRASVGPVAAQHYPFSSLV